MRKIAIIVFFAIFLDFGFSQIEYLGIETNIKENNVIVDLNVIGNKSFEFKIYGLILNYSSTSGCKVDGNFFSCDFRNETKMNIRINLNNVLTKGPGKNILLVQFELMNKVEYVTSLIILPLGMILVNESGSIFPQNYKMLTNGRNIIVYWEFMNVSTYQPLFFKVTYMPAVSEGSEILKFLKSFYVSIIIGLFFIILLFYELFKSKRVVIKKVKVVPEKIVLEVLDSDEKKIYEIVQKEGKIKQNKLVELTGFSKARVSRVVKKLREKKLINLERIGKTNLISLKKKT
ncbi:MAG: winged helix-turn-helix transcriptional regulator [Candidatus Aenigmatarchaeota archaeon]